LVLKAGTIVLPAALNHISVPAFASMPVIDDDVSMKISDRYENAARDLEDLAGKLDELIPYVVDEGQREFVKADAQQLRSKAATYRSLAVLHGEFRQPD
jgi:hypothetical protein